MDLTSILLLFYLSAASSPIKGLFHVSLFQPFLRGGSLLKRIKAHNEAFTRRVLHMAESAAFLCNAPGL